MANRIFGGLDPSYSCTACVALDSEGLVERLRIRTAKKDFPSAPARLVQIRTKVLEFFDAHQPVLIAIEGYAHGAKHGREQAGELGGQLRVALWEGGFSFVTVGITTLKAFIAGKGNADKSVLMREVFRRWKYDALDDNDCDAYGLARVAEEFAAPIPHVRTRRLQKLIGQLEVTRCRK